MKKGFTLVEIMIVIAIIAALAAIAIPNLLRARVNANESGAIATVRTISSAVESYRAVQSPPAYPDSLGDLINATPAYLDDRYNGTTPSVQGYNYTYSQTNDNQYTLTAAPATANVTGTRTFFVDETGVIRLDDADGTAIQ
ncbi:MAG: prepilin-type N-terminal cleavage/methylation domain-containing protein [Candidatus Omnitrophota bacterium]